MNQLMKFPPILDGEILLPGDDIRVIVQLHPFSAKKVEFHVPLGESLQEIEGRVRNGEMAYEGMGDFDVRIQGEIIYPDLWAKVRPKAGTIVSFRGRPAGFIAPIIAGISAAFTAFGSMIGGMGFLGQLLMSGIGMGIKFLLNKLFAPRTPEKLPDAKTSYAISTTRNQSAPWEAVPLVLGKHRLAPFYGALPYTEMSGDDQYLRVLFVWGYGPLDITDIKIGETLLSTFDDVEIQTNFGYPGDPNQSLYPNQVIEEPLSIELADTTFSNRTTAENITEISIDLVLPNGLVLINQDGNHSQTVTIQWHYRLVGTVPWTTPANIVITAKTRDTIRKTYRATVAAGQYEVEVRRAVAKKTYGSDTSDVEDVYWTAVRAMRPGVPLTFTDPIAVTAIRIKATSQLNGSLETLNGVVTSRCEHWNGTSWVTEAATENPADLFLHVLQGPANKNPVTDDRIDFESLQGWADYCTTSGWRFDQVRVDRTSVYECILDICAAGRAMPVFKDGKWSVIWDEQTSNIVQMFTPRNSWDFESTRQYQQPVHGYRVRFVNEDKGWVEDERVVYDDGYNIGNATIFQGLDLPGVTDKDLVWKHGRYHIAQSRLRPEIYTLTTDFENIVCTRGDRIRVAHDIMLVGLQSGRVTNVVGTTVSIDEWVNLLADHQYMLRFRLNDGTFLTKNVVFGTNGELQDLPLAAGTMPSIGDLFTFGESGSDSAIYRVLSIEPGSDLSAKISFVDDAPEIYDADTGLIPAFDSNVSGPMDPLQVAPSDLRFTSGIYLVEGVQYLGFVNLNWRQPRQGNILSTEIQIFRDAAWQVVGQVPGNVSTFRVDGLMYGSYSFRVRALYRDTTNSSWVTSEVVDIGALLATVAPNVTGFRISTIGDISSLSWDSVQLAGERYEIRFAPVTIGAANWNSAITLIPATNNTTIQVPTMVGVYFIKADSPTASKSAIAALVASNVLSIQDLNVVEVIQEQPTFTGPKSYVVLSGSTIRLDTYLAGLRTQGTYYFANSLDLADAYTSRLSATIEAFGEDIHGHMHDWATLSSVAKMASTDPDSWRVYLELRTTLGSPITTVTRTGASATYVNASGNITTIAANLPRYNFNRLDLLADPTLLHELAATNSILQSNDFTNAAWSKTNVTVTAGSFTLAGLSFSKLQVTASATTTLSQAVASAGSATGNTFSIFVKKGSGPTEANQFFLRNDTTAVTLVGITVNLDDGTFVYTTGSAGAVVEDWGDGIWRIKLSNTAGISAGNTIRGYVGWNSTAAIAGQYVYAAGAQLEAGMSATSYIPTTTVAVARGVETITFTPTWTDWQPFVVGDVTFRAIEFRLQMFGKVSSDPAILYGTVTPVVNRLEVSIDMPDRVIADNDLAVGTGGLSIVFDPPFLELSGIATADQDMATGDRKVITAKSEAGFTIQFFNSVGTAVARTIDYVAKGYGRKHL